MMKKFFSKMVLLMTGVVMLTACNDDDDNGQPYSYVIANHGVFVVNEGSYFSKINGLVVLPIMLSSIMDACL